MMRIKHTQHSFHWSDNKSEDSCHNGKRRATPEILRSEGIKRDPSDEPSTGSSMNSATLSHLDGSHNDEMLMPED